MLDNDDPLSKLSDSIAEFRTDEIRRNVGEALNMGIHPQDIVRALSKGLNVVGDRYQKGEAFLPELIAAGETMREAMEVIAPHIKKGSVESYGVVSIGTVKGDLHEIGKNIVKLFLTASGFEVHDLGVDVAAEKFAQSAEASCSGIVAMSALLTTAVPEIKMTVRSLEESGLRKKVKVIVGGAALSEQIAREVLADAYEADAVAGTSRCVGWTRKGV